MAKRNFVTFCELFFKWIKSCNFTAKMQFAVFKSIFGAFGMKLYDIKLLIQKDQCLRIFLMFLLAYLYLGKNLFFRDAY